MAFTHVQGNSGSSSVTALTVAVTLGSTPTAGNLVCVGISAFNATGTPVLSTVQDNAGTPNSYQVTPNSPAAANNTTAGCIWEAYLLTVPSGAGKIITATFTSTNEPSSAEIWAEEFSVSGGSQSFDKDVAGSGTGSSVNSPSITPTNANSLLFSAACVANTITAPTGGGTAGVWTGAAGGITSGNMAEYDLSATSATAVNYTQSAGTQWDSMAMAFFISASTVNRGWPFPSAGPGYAI